MHTVQCGKQNLFDISAVSADDKAAFDQIVLIPPVSKERVCEEIGCSADRRE